MKKTIPFFILLIHSLTYSQDFKSPDAIKVLAEKEQQEKMRMHKVKKRYKYLYRFDTITNSEPVKILLGYTLYNENGQPIEKTETGFDNSKIYYKYDKKQKLINKNSEYRSTSYDLDLQKQAKNDFLKKGLNNIAITKGYDFYEKFQHNKNGGLKKVRSKTITYYEDHENRMFNIKIYHYKNIHRLTSDLVNEEENYELLCSVSNGKSVISQFLYDSINMIYVEKNYRYDHYSVTIYYLNKDFKPYKKEYIYTPKKIHQEVLKYAMSTYNPAPVDVHKVEPDRNKMVNIINKRSEHSMNTTLYKYDKNGNVIETFNSNPGILAGELYHHITYRYNDKELMVEQVVHKKDETDDHRYRYDYEFYE